MTKPKLLIAATKYDIADETAEWKAMCESVDVTIVQLTTKEQFISDLQTKYNDVQAIWNCSSGLFEIGGVNAFIDYFPESMKLFVLPWVGHDSIDGKKLREKGIALCNIGPNAGEDVADVALFLTLAAFRMTSFWEHSFRTLEQDIIGCRDYLGSETFHHKTKYPSKVHPEKQKMLNMSKDFKFGGKTMATPFGKKAGIIGFGAIGKAIGKRLIALGMEVHYTKRTPLTEEEETRLGYHGVFHESLETMLPVVDLVVLALPGGAATTNTLNKETLSLCKHGVRVVNVGRGNAIDEDALIEALDSGLVTSAGLDVLQNEPSHVDSRFLQRWDFTVLPHIGSASVDNAINSTIASVQNVMDVLVNGGPGVYPVN